MIGKTCSRCGIYKSLRGFYKHSGNWYHTYCKKCFLRACKKRYLKTKDKTKERFIRGKKLINLYKNRPCADCQGWYEPCQMDFDHRDASKKLFVIGEGAFRNLNVLKNEVAKCDVVCANCHRLRTHKRGLYNA